MRTTLNLDDHLLRAAKREAVTRGVTLTSVVENALRAGLTPKPSWRDFSVRLPVVTGRRPPEVDVADRGTLYDRMEDRGADG